MNIKKHIELAHFETNTSKNQYPAGYLIEWINREYRKLWRMIENMDAGYFWNTWTTDIQKGAREYEIQRQKREESGIWTAGIAKIKSVKIKVGEHYEELPMLAEHQRGDGRKGRRLSDNHIFLSGSPDKDIADGLMIEGVEKLEDLTEESTIEDVFPGNPDLEPAFDLLILGLKIQLREGKQEYEKANMAKQIYLEKQEELRRWITNRVQKTFYTELDY